MLLESYNYYNRFIQTKRTKHLKMLYKHYVLLVAN